MFSLIFLLLFIEIPLLGHSQSTICAKGNSICIPKDYSKFDLPNETQTVVNVGIDIKDIPKIADKEFSVTLNAFFLVRWEDRRLVIDQNTIEKNLNPDDDPDAWIPVDVSFIKEFWLPDAEILNLKEFETLNVLSKLEGLWLNRKYEIMYAVATRITFICPMTFNNFPLDVQVCLFQVRMSTLIYLQIFLWLFSFPGSGNIEYEMSNFNQKPLRQTYSNLFQSISGWVFQLRQYEDGFRRRVHR